MIKLLRSVAVQFMKAISFASNVAELSCEIKSFIRFGN